VNKNVLKSSLFLNLLSVGAATFVAKLIGLIALGYPARVLGPQNYGLIGFGVSVTAYASIVVLPGMLAWGTREIARDPARTGELLVTVNLTRILIASCAYGGLACYAYYFLPSALERSVVLLCGLALFNAALAVDWVFNGLELMRIPAWVGVAVSGCNVVALFTLVKGPGDLLIFAALAPANGLATVVISCLLLSRKHLRLVLPSRQMFKLSLVKSLPLGVMVSAIVVIHYANNLIVKSYLGSAALGIFMAAFFLLELTSTLPGILGTVFLPRLSRNVVRDREAALRETRIFAQVHMACGFFIAAFAFIEAPAIIAAIYGPKFAASADLLRVMSFGIIFNFAITGYTNCLISFGRDRVMLLVVVVSALVSVGGGLLLVPRFGALGAAGVVALIDLSGWLVSLPYYRRSIGSLHLGTWLMPALGALCIIVVSGVLQKAGLEVWWRIPLVAFCFVPFVLNDARNVLTSLKPPLATVGDLNA
jgi:O-antigen/teichoic acid export membrane protein